MTGRYGSHWLNRQRLEHLRSTLALAAMFRRNGYHPELLDRLAGTLTHKEAPMPREEWEQLDRACKLWVDANAPAMIRKESDRGFDSGSYPMSAV